MFSVNICVSVSFPMRGYNVCTFPETEVALILWPVFKVLPQATRTYCFQITDRRTHKFTYKGEIHTLNLDVFCVSK